jgi:phage-related holin
LKSQLQQIFETGLTGKLIALMISGFVAFMSPISDVLYFVGFIVVCDFITGIIKANKAGDFNSTRMRDKFWDSVGYFIGIIIAHYVEMIFGNTVPLVKAVVAIIALTELQSVRENITEITGTDILKPIINLIKTKND